MGKETNMTPKLMVSWHGDDAIKAKYLARVEAHRIADELVQGTGFEGGKGCAVGCTFDNYNHARGPIEIGVPEWLMRLEDVIFEGLPQEKAMMWPTQFLLAIPVGANLEPVQWQLAILRHKRQLDVLATNPEPYARQAEQALHMTISYCNLRLTPCDDLLAQSAACSVAHLTARAAAESAQPAICAARMAARMAAYSAHSAAYSAAHSAAHSAAESARSAAYSAHSAYSAAYWAAHSAAHSAYSAAYSAAHSAAESAHYEWEAETLLMLLRETAITPKVAC
jgi:hypothetical protein